MNAKEFSFGREVCSTHCSENIVKGAVTVHNDKVYFASESCIHVLNATHKKPHWLPKIEFNRKKFALTAINDMLLAVGGHVDGKPAFSAESSVQCYPLDNHSKKWEEKYPSMAVARFDPEVVSCPNYVIVIAGQTTNGPELSVEILSLKEEQWHLIESMKLPDYLNSMSWMSACVCNDTIYLTAMHNDHHYNENITPDEDEDDVTLFMVPYDDYFMDSSPYKCCSLFQCFISDFSQMDSFTWQTLNHPHPATYESGNEYHFMASDIVTKEDKQEYAENFGIFPSDQEYQLTTSYFHYGDCKYSLLSIDGQLFAVGCSHIEAVSPNDMQDSLKEIYKSYMNIKAVLNKYEEEVFDYDGNSNMNAHVIDHKDSYDSSCAIHMYVPDKDVWKLLHKIEDFGLTSDQPLAASVENSLVIVRATTDARVLHFEQN